ncbi:hypothetical protein D0809_12505 [Flavobacterium circumlabens]|uniref:Uncharacterized protein n=1 Tax=Flavobacterium circumlabens TaxID=2133765 RepID=A0A4Y7UBN5_9FLAO|nr:hypothetical protein [Flavobacterium circumlabens]TCN57391.1 hypothetical protein EV142_10447 [Flavobacterium circumlabens]TEB43714.1 hypothetical protein D0809_12505 [Flavobacterium circumlabens]
MIYKVLKNLVYLYYPKNICFNTENGKYIVSDEYVRLNQIITKFDSEYRQDISENILKEFEKDYSLKNFADFTLFDWGDRCMTFNLSIIEDGELYTISLLLSVVIPYYVIECKKNKIELLFSESKIIELQEANKETRKLNDLILKIEAIVEEKLLYKKLPNEIINFEIEDVSFQDAGFGHFKMFNAFFNNLILEKNEE